MESTERVVNLYEQWRTAKKASQLDAVADEVLKITPGEVACFTLLVCDGMGKQEAWDMVTLLRQRQEHVKIE